MIIAESRDCATGDAAVVYAFTFPAPPAGGLLRLALEFHRKGDLTEGEALCLAEDCSAEPLEVGDLLLFVRLSGAG